MYYVGLTAQPVAGSGDASHAGCHGARLQEGSHDVGTHEDCERRRRIKEAH